MQTAWLKRGRSRSHSAEVMARRRGSATRIGLNSMVTGRPPWARQTASNQGLREPTTATSRPPAGNRSMASCSQRSVWS